jgi:hypothetical protein
VENLRVFLLADLQGGAEFETIPGKRICKKKTKKIIRIL